MKENKDEFFAKLSNTNMSFSWNVKYEHVFRQNCIEHREHDGTRTLVYSVIPGMDKSVKHSFAVGNYIDDIVLVIWILNFVDT